MTNTERPPDEPEIVATATEARQAQPYRHGMMRNVLWLSMGLAIVVLIIALLVFIT